MGKNRIIKIIGKLIAGMTAHKILIKYNLTPKSDNHLHKEEQSYGGQIEDNLTEFNWNDYDKEKIKREAEKSLKKELKKKHFIGVNFPNDEKNIILNKTFNEFFDISLK